jgi:Uma2 family endonuclease
MTVSTIELHLRSADATWCYEKWEQLPDDGNRYEVIDGVLYMSTAPDNLHQYISACLTERVGIPLKLAGVAIYAYAPVGVIMPGAEPVQPDFLLIRTEHASIAPARGRIQGVPDLIAEILSPNNPRHDTVTKRATYARAGVPEYWILRPDEQDVLVLSQPKAALADYADSRLFTTEQELVSPTMSIRVAVAALFELPPGVE